MNISNYSKTIAHKFNQKALQYDEYACLQKEIADILFKIAYSEILLAENILDLGCGTGYLLKEIKNVTGKDKKNIYALDLAWNMLKQAQIHKSKSFFLQADAHQLPFKENVLDLILSNFVIQWLDLDNLLQELYSILKPGGKIIFSTLLLPSLWQLTQAWRAIDDKPHTLNFLSQNDYLEKISFSKFNVIQHQKIEKTLWFKSEKDLLESFKKIGSNLIVSQEQRGLTGKSKLRLLFQELQKYKMNQGYPLNYTIFISTLEKKDEKQ